VGAGWAAVAAAVGRSKKMCRERWCPAWTAEEDTELLRCVAALGGARRAWTKRCSSPRWHGLIALRASLSQAHAPKKLAVAFQRTSARTLLQIQARAYALADAGGERGRAPEVAAAAAPAPAEAWAAINRRRVLHRGWHVDIGPGFDTSRARTAVGHPYQGLVVLVLLSDWAPGGGGTAVRRGTWARVTLDRF
jgi:hypothetical protein